MIDKHETIHRMMVIRDAARSMESTAESMRLFVDSIIEELSQAKERTENREQN